MRSVGVMDRSRDRGRPSSFAAWAAGLLLLLGRLGLGAAPAQAERGRKRFGGDQGNGRIYDTERLRSARSLAAPGRYMSRPDIPEPDIERPLRSTAAIPDPTPRMQGGSRYKRDGKYFYATADDPVLSHKTGKQQYRNLIPSPETLESRRKSSAATR